MTRVLLPAVLLLFGCGGGGQAGGGAGEEAMTEAAGPRGAASITGVVHFTGTAPANPAIDMAEEPDCEVKHTGTPRDPQVVVGDGMLANVFVYIKSGVEGSYTPPSAPVALDQNGCLYDPRVFGVMVGQPIEILNSDPMMHNIKAIPEENRGFNISQPVEGMTTRRTFKTPEVMVPFECNVHGWMHSFVGVLDHPFYATSGPDGSFTIEGVPAGTYEVGAWHEVFGTQTMTVTVGDSVTVSAEFTFSASAT